jgi:hypothetical protein
MTPYETYCCHLAIRTHFQEERYDCFANEGRLKNTRVGYKKCDQKLMYQRLSRHRDPASVILANVVADRGNFIADIISREGMTRYDQWLQRKEAGPYQFREQLEQLKWPFVQNIKVINHQHPPLLTRYAKGKFSLENLIVINELTGCFEYWQSLLLDPVYWPKHYMKAKKYRPFLSLDFSKYRKVLLDLAEEKC